MSNKIISGSPDYKRGTVLAESEMWVLETTHPHPQPPLTCYCPTEVHPQEDPGTRGTSNHCPIPALGLSGWGLKKFMGTWKLPKHQTVAESPFTSHDFSFTFPDLPKFRAIRNPGDSLTPPSAPRFLKFQPFTHHVHFRFQHSHSSWGILPDLGSPQISL